jgi:hypothetical protein
MQFNSGNEFSMDMSHIVLKKSSKENPP